MRTGQRRLAKSTVRKQSVVVGIVEAVMHPVEYMARKTGCVEAPKCRRKQAKRHRRLKYLIGSGLMTAGSALALNAGLFATTHVGHVLVDVMAYGVHGIGSTPFVLRVVKALALE